MRRGRRPNARRRIPVLGRNGIRPDLCVLKRHRTRWISNRMRTSTGGLVRSVLLFAAAARHPLRLRLQRQLQLLPPPPPFRQSSRCSSCRMQGGRQWQFDRSLEARDTGSRLLAVTRWPRSEIRKYRDS